MNFIYFFSFESGMQKNIIVVKKMGIYIFQSLVDDQWVKVGHHRITTRRPNVWYRVARRGFNSCKCPSQIRGKTDVHQLKLLAFYPTLTSGHERRLHRENKACRIGEWYRTDQLPRICTFLEQTLGGTSVPVADEDKIKALAWAGKYNAY